VDDQIGGPHERLGSEAAGHITRLFVTRGKTGREAMSSRTPFRRAKLEELFSAATSIENVHVQDSLIDLHDCCKDLSE
jgi:hypothetical protein